MATRRMRAFKRWMKSKGVEWSDALEFVETPEKGISVRTLSQLKEHDVVAKIPKEACLTIKTSGASQIIEDAGLEFHMGLAFAIMYERSLGEDSPWACYLQLLPYLESLPFVWTLNEVNKLLRGTELHRAVKADKALFYEEWKENILPLLDVAPLKLNQNFFGVEQYFAARSLIFSRAFEIDDYHGSGMVPLADLFNHKTTGAEDVHFTAIMSGYIPEKKKYFDCYNIDKGTVDGEGLAQDSSIDSNTAHAGNCIGSDSECYFTDGDPSILEMIVIKDVSSGTEVFNTYAPVNNAALLHRYGFTEQENRSGMVNINLKLVLQWCSSLFSDRHGRTRVSLWRKIGYSTWECENSEFFEISLNGEPQVELLTLLHIMFLSDDTYHKFDQLLSNGGYCPPEFTAASLLNDRIFSKEAPEVAKKSLLNKNKKVCDALLWLADKRESLYGSESIEDDIEALGRCSSVKDKKLYHSLVLRISERKILQKLRNFVSQPLEVNNHSSARNQTSVSMLKGDGADPQAAHRGLASRDSAESLQLREEIERMREVQRLEIEELRAHQREMELMRQAHQREMELVRQAHQRSLQELASMQRTMKRNMDMMMACLEAAKARHGLGAPSSSRQPRPDPPYNDDYDEEDVEKSSAARSVRRCRSS